MSFKNTWKRLLLCTAVLGLIAPLGLTTANAAQNKQQVQQQQQQKQKQQQLPQKQPQNPSVNIDDLGSNTNTGLSGKIPLDLHDFSEDNLNVYGGNSPVQVGANPKIQVATNAQQLKQLAGQKNTIVVLTESISFNGKPIKHSNQAQKPGNQKAIAKLPKKQQATMKKKQAKAKKQAKKQAQNSQLNIASNTEIVGYTPGVTLQGATVNINKAQNVQLRNIGIQAPKKKPAVNVNASHNIQLDHLKVFGSAKAQNLMNVDNASNEILISNNEFMNTNKNDGRSNNKDLNIGDSNNSSMGPKATVIHNDFMGSQEAPQVANGRVDVLDNKYENKSSINAQSGAQLKVEGNHFAKGSKKRSLISKNNAKAVYVKDNRIGRHKMHMRHGTKPNIPRHDYPSDDEQLGFGNDVNLLGAEMNAQQAGQQQGSQSGAQQGANKNNQHKSKKNLIKLRNKIRNKDCNKLLKIFDPQLQAMGVSKRKIAKFNREYRKQYDKSFDKSYNAAFKNKSHITVMNNDHNAAKAGKKSGTNSDIMKILHRNSKQVENNE